ncbi:MAG TPA: hypothetical protein PKD09_21805 [Aggregatilinea sp.]|uniref:ferritin-like domain-containing protein n=1 Tax=Aggregatilinea sp. TaxID=2806333 RepID=UPI002B9BC9D4|nr:hypothetical protein [Aggregatilinea sp.]HML24306.1 hypothetical protein [Aggregatilinea sp.]
MLNKRLVKFGFFALVMAGVVALSLAVMTESSYAQGPGNRGGGRGGQGGGYQANQGTGYQANQGTGLQNGGAMGAGQAGTAGQQGAGNMGAGGQVGVGQGVLCCLPPAVEGDVPADVIDALTAGLSDEYNAYNIYQAVIDQFGAVRPFTNIQRAEASHIASLEFLFDRYGIAIPDVSAAVDVQFSTLADACATAADAEVANLDLYDSWIATAQNYPDMVQVFTSLRDASEFQHLPAFQNCAGY